MLKRDSASMRGQAPSRFILLKKCKECVGDLQRSQVENSLQGVQRPRPSEVQKISRLRGV
jgi:hypothetical protein